MIQLDSATLRALIAPRGAALAGLWAAGWSHSLVLGSPAAAGHSEHLGYFGALVGPIANRVAGARLSIDGCEWSLEANEGTTCLHGGPGGLHARVWDIAAQTPNSVRLACNLAHGEGGLPGNRRIEAHYRLEDRALVLEITATSDRTTALNIAHHPYWNLDGRPTVAAHRLEVPAEHYLPVDARTLPTGEIAAVAGTDYDFRTAAPVSTARTLDANLCLSMSRCEAPQRAAVLTAPGGPRLEVLSTEPGLQVYNGSGLGPVPAPLHDGRALVPFAGLALEPQGWPDAPHHPDFPSILVEAGARYRQITAYRLSE